LAKTLNIGEVISRRKKKLEYDISSNGKGLEERIPSSNVKILVWIHQVAIVLLNLD
jgi:hypothetical protein